MSIDNLLTEEALRRLKFVCDHGTYWHGVKPEGYLEAFLSDGFHHDIVLQIAEEFPKKFPQIFGDHKLSQVRAHKYDSNMEPSPILADKAELQIHLWITDDDANQDPDSGGIIVYKQKAPHNWANTAAVAEEAQRKLQELKTEKVKVSYRANRAVFFDANVLHQMDDFTFKSGYNERRISISFIYGEYPQQPFDINAALHKFKVEI